MSEGPPHRRKFVTGIIIVVAGIFVLQFILFRKPRFTEIMKHTAAELNKTCPVMADSDTRLDSSAVPADRTFQYHYTLMNVSRDSADADLMQLSIQPAILNNVRTNPDLELFRKNHVTFVYRFGDVSGRPVFSVSVTPEQYGAGY